LRDDRVELGAARRNGDGEAVSGEILGDHGAKLRLVVDDDDPLPSCHCGFR
jgi:hypothetical protein